MRVLHAYNQHRGGGGADNAARATIQVSRAHGLEVEVFTRSSEDLPRNLAGRIRAGTSAIFPPAAVGEFDRLLASFQPDVVHIHEVFPLVSPWILPKCARRGVPVVMTTVDYRLTCPIGTHLRDGAVCNRCAGGREYRAALGNCRGKVTESVTVALYNTIARRFRLFSDHVSRFIAPSEFTRQWMIENAGIDASRIVAVSPLVEIPAAPADAGSGCYVGYASRFSHEKGFDALVEAARRSGVPFRLSRNEHGLVRVAVPAEMEVEVTRSKADLDAFYRGCRMLAFPSIWFETFGLVGAEAMSHGIPVLASRIGALTELVDDGVDGLLFEPGDSGDLARQVTRLWNDPELCRRLGAAGRAKAVARWSPEAHFRQVHAIYQAACGHVRAAAVADCAAPRSAQPPPARAVQPAHPGRREPVAARDAR